MPISKLKFFCLLIFTGLNIPVNVIAQGLNHNWQIGYTSGTDTNVISKRAWLKFYQDSISGFPDSFKMAFRATQGNISDENGNLLMVSNGCWVANATGDTMMNGSGINPGTFTDSWNSSITGLPLPHGNLIVPFPGDSTKYVMFHQTGNNSANLSSTELYYSVIDMALDGGLGGIVTTQKNVIAFHDTLSWGISACKHSNGRDWWITALQDISDTIITILFTPTGVASISKQSFSFPAVNHNACQPVFSPDGKKFAFTSTYGFNPNYWYHDLRLFSFDRCSGIFYDPHLIDLADSIPGFATAFSSDSKYLYASSFSKIYQFNSDTSNINASRQTVAVYDGYCAPFSITCTDFWYMYLAANGKIYISSGSSVIDMHYINYPDSGGIACDVQQHALHLPCFSGRGNVNHPNYYLRAVDGSICDSLGLSVQEINHNFHFSLFPNPSNGNFSISYLLPQNKEGRLEVFDITGKCIYKMNLPMWSTLQQITLPHVSEGLYNCVITAGSTRTFKKIALVK